MAAPTGPPELPMYFVFNAFEEIPPPPDFPTFVEGWQHTGSFVQKNKCFMVAQLHRNIDPQGKYKFVNHAAFDGPDFAAFKIGLQQQPPKDFLEVALKGHGPPGHQKKHPGGYGELATSTGKPLGPWLQRDKNSLWILVGINVDQSNAADFEKNWRSSTGADFILNAPKELGISNVAVYKKFTPRPALDYYLRAEITGIKDDKVEPAVKFLNELKEVKYPAGVTATDFGLYKTDPEYILYPEAGKKDLPSGFSWIPT